MYHRSIWHDAVLNMAALDGMQQSLTGLHSAQGSSVAWFMQGFAEGWQPFLSFGPQKASSIVSASQLLLSLCLCRQANVSQTLSGTVSLRHRLLELAPAGA